MRVRMRGRGEERKGEEGRGTGKEGRERGIRLRMRGRGDDAFSVIITTMKKCLLSTTTDNVIGKCYLNFL